MPKFCVEIIYEPFPKWTEKNKIKFDPPSNENNIADTQRVYITVVSARNERDACNKAKISRREANPEKRIYDFNVVGCSARKCP